MGFGDELVDFQKAFIVSHGDEPTTIHPPKADELALGGMSVDEAGGDVHDNVREHYTTSCEQHLSRERHY